MLKTIFLYTEKTLQINQKLDFEINTFCIL